MITALDTNILIALWDKEEEISSAAQTALDSAFEQGGLVICAAVYAELLAFPRRTQEFLDGFFEDTGILIDWELNETIWRKAGAAFQSYTRRRRKAGAAQPRRILADFVIGAHADTKKYPLLTLDERIYRTAFPRLKITTI